MCLGEDRAQAGPAAFGLAFLAAKIRPLTFAPLADFCVSLSGHRI